MSTIDRIPTVTDHPSFGNHEGASNDAILLAREKFLAFRGPNGRTRRLGYLALGPEAIDAIGRIREKRAAAKTPES